MGSATAWVAVAALLAAVTNADLERAISVGRSPDAARARFHARYTIDMQDATVEQFDIMTEFRRAATIIEERERLGDHMFGLRQLEAAVRPFHNQVTVRARLRFHPMNVLPGVPRYEIRVGEPSDRLLALGPTSRTPTYVQSGDTTQALMGAVLELAFDSGIVGQARLPISVVLDGRTIAATSFDFSTIE